MHNPTSIRLCFHSSSNSSFPAVVDDRFFEALRNGNAHEGHALNETALQRLGVLNPIATSIGFHNMIHTVFSVLVGLPPSR